MKSKAELIVALIGITAFSNLPLRAEDQEGESRGYRLTRQATYLYTDFLEGDDATTLGLETDAQFGLGSLHGRHIAYLEVADYPRVIPGKAISTEADSNAVEEATGITDLLTGVWFSGGSESHSGLHLGYGLGLQMPTASDEALGTGKWSTGPSIDVEYQAGRFFGGFILIQLWSFTGDSDRKDVNTLIGKYFLMYDLAENWKLISIPYGVTYYWNKPSDEALSLPLGGGIERSFSLGSQKMALHLQYFNYVVRPSKGSEADLRLTLELYF